MPCRVRVGPFAWRASQCVHCEEFALASGLSCWVFRRLARFWQFTITYDAADLDGLLCTHLDLMGCDGCAKLVA